MNLQLLLPVIGGLFVIETLSVVIQVVSFRVFGRRVLPHGARSTTTSSCWAGPRPRSSCASGSSAGLFAALGLGIFYADFLSVTGLH